MAKQTQKDPPVLSREEVAGLLEAAQYTFAKTMPQDPHWYTKRETWADDRVFLAAVQAIRDHGVRRRWKSAWITYFDAGKYMYWTGWQPPEQQFWINRALRPEDGSTVTREEGVRANLGVRPDQGPQRTGGQPGLGNQGHDPNAAGL